MVASRAAFPLYSLCTPDERSRPEIIMRFISPLVPPSPPRDDNVAIRHSSCARRVVRRMSNANGPGDLYLLERTGARTAAAVSLREVGPPRAKSVPRD